MPKRVCPICVESWFDIDHSLSVCRRHQHWLVTECAFCGKVCFSPMVHECVKCAGGISDTAAHEHPYNAKGSSNPVNYLIFIGQEGKSTRGYW